jgi:hypothetical protein
MAVKLEGKSRPFGLQGPRRPNVPPEKRAPQLTAARGDSFEPARALQAVHTLRVPLEAKTFLEPGAIVSHGVIVHNEVIAQHLHGHYTTETLAALRSVLDDLGTVRIDTLPNGLPQAAVLSAGSRAAELHYDAVWTRDAIFIARAWRATGEAKKATAVITSLLAYYRTHEQLKRVLSGVNAAAAGDVKWAKSQRPHIKFNGSQLFLAETFAQARAGLRSLSDEDLQPLVLLASYLKGIDFSTDRELGHWEEAGRQNGKVSASTLRAVLAGLTEMKRWSKEDPSRRSRLQRIFESQVGAHARSFMSFGDGSSLHSMIARGKSALDGLLPLESKGEGIYHRTADLALTTALFLDVTAEANDQIISPQMRKTILANLQSELRRSHGDARYAGDGYWGAYFSAKEPMRVERMNSLSLEDRLAGGMKKKGEAQWTLGAPILSVIWGKLYQQTRKPEYLERQTFELNRALGMITGKHSALGPGTIPESYLQVRATSLERPGEELWTFAENPLPLNWAKANLRLAMETMRQSLASGK